MRERVFEAMLVIAVGLTIGESRAADPVVTGGSLQNGVWRVKASSTSTTVTAGNQVELSLNGTTFTQNVAIDSQDYDRSLTVFAKEKTAGAIVRSIVVLVDNTPPSIVSVVAQRRAAGAIYVTALLSDDDISPQAVSSTGFQLLRTGSDDGKAPSQEPELSRDRKSIGLVFSDIEPGNYALAVKESIKDSVGWPHPTRSYSFSLGQAASRGDQVEYPQFLAPGFRQDDLNPGDRVDTRVVNLYYYRDARHIAEIINRTIQDLNQTGYDDAQKFAEQARTVAETAVDKRRTQEQLAVDAAVKTRDIERRLEEARRDLEENRQKELQRKYAATEVENAARAITGGDGKSVDAEITKVDNEIAATAAEIGRLEPQINATPAPANIGTLRKDLQTARDKFNDLQRKRITLRQLQLRLEDSKAAETRLSDEKTTLDRLLNADTGLPSQIANAQNQEIQERNRLLGAEQDEDRKVAEQFRREVAAGIADRNGYAKGKLESRDPVAQVSISVVGANRLQLRGPIKGLNRICRMIHQLDTPVGQVKVGIHTVQVNGEHGNRMDVVYERINREVQHARFLVNASGQLMRRAVQEVASEVALEADQGMYPNLCPPVPTVDPATGESLPLDQIAQDKLMRDRRYLYAFFGGDFIGELEELDSELLNTENKLLSLNSMDTISLAGAMFVLAHADHPIRQRIMMRFEQLIAGELPLRERENLRSLTQLTSHGNPLSKHISKAMRVDAKIDEEVFFNSSRTYRFPSTVTFFQNTISTPGTLSPAQLATVKMAEALKAQMTSELEYRNLSLEWSLLPSDEHLQQAYTQDREAFVNAESAAKAGLRNLSEVASLAFQRATLRPVNDADTGGIRQAISEMQTNELQDLARRAIASKRAADRFIISIKNPRVDVILDEGDGARLVEKDAEYAAQRGRLDACRQSFETSREKLRSKRLLEQFMDEQEQQSVDLMEAIRHHSSNVDNYLKRLAIAVEEDVDAQFYAPAFQRIRRVSRSWDVTLGQIETTTILTNNRTMARVLPGASFEFNLPPRQILMTEALQGAKALINEYGNLTQDPTFIGGVKLLSGGTATGIVGSSAPIQTIPGQAPEYQPGSELEKLIPDPAVYKFETGTGFEIVPVIQPDGNSIVYSFDYQFTTKVREPVRADEKHLGRINRHLLHTDVQTSSYELREISRYTVALKASRTDRGVPGLEDIPGVGILFRPLPQDESSLQTNIILGSSTIYPTVFDLIGLRWSPYVEAMHSSRLNAEKSEQLSRRQTLRDSLLQKTRGEVNSVLGIQESQPPRVNFRVE